VPNASPQEAGNAMMNQRIVDELRRMFTEAATPSRLMHFLEQHFKNDPRLHFLIMDYFREAFGMPLVRNVLAGDDYSPSIRHAHYNRDVVPEIVQRIEAWNAANLEGSWLDGLSVSSLTDHTERLKVARFEELDRVWDTLSDSERLFIIRKVALKDYYWDVVKSLALLAERLQQQVVELEDRLKKALPAGNVPVG
jgi:hypothetical protein